MPIDHRLQTKSQNLNGLLEYSFEDIRHSGATTNVCTGRKKKMSDENSELDEIDLGFSDLGSAESVSNSSLSPPRHQDAPNFNFGFSAPVNITQTLFRREMGYGSFKLFKQTFLKSYRLSNIFPHQILLSHIFMGMTKCGRFLITYTMITDQDDDEWYATVYKYRLHWWNFKPGGQARKIAEVSLFGNHKIAAPLQIYVCQWPQDFDKILVYGLIRECTSIDASGSSSNQHAFVTVTALPALNNCQDCRTVASSYMLDDIAASWDTCLRFSCLKHGYTVHTSFDVVVPYPEFLPKISLKCNEYAVFNANNFLYALRITLGNCEKKIKDESEEIPYQIRLFESCEDANRIPEENLPSCSLIPHNLTSSQNKALKLKEQIIQDFSEETNSNLSVKKSPESSSSDRNLEEVRIDPFPFLAVRDVNQEEKCAYDYTTSPPLPTRVDPIRTRNVEKRLEEGKKSLLDELGAFEAKEEINVDVGEYKCETKEDGSKKEEWPDRDCFRYPMSPNHVKRTKVEQRKSGGFEKSRTQEVYKNENNCSKKCFKSFFTRRKVQRSNLNFGMFIRNSSFAKSILKSPKSVGEGDIHSVLESGRHRMRNPKENAESAYEFVDDTQHEVEKLSQFRKKRLADKKYEFQDFDSENIVPFSIVRQENTLKSPKKFLEVENEDSLSVKLELRFGNEGVDSSEKNEKILRSPSPRYPLDLSISVPSPRSPLILEILSSPTQYDGVLRPFNRNTNGNPLLSPMAKYLSSPPSNAQKPSSKQATKDCWKSKGCDEFRLNKSSQGANKCSTNLDTRFILENGILINDISDWYFKEEMDLKETEIYRNLFRNLNKFHGEAVRFERRFVEVDDELVSVITDIEDDDTSAVTGYHTALNVEVHGAGYCQLQMISNSKVEKLAAPCVVVDQQSLDIEGICHSVATTLCQVSNKTFTFCNDYDIEILDVCPRSGDVLVLLMMRIEGAEGIRDEVSKLEQYEASVTLIWNLHRGNYKVCMVVPPQKVNWVWDSKAVWNPAKEASRRFRMQLPADVTFCDPAVRVCGNNSALRGISLSRIEDLENGIQFVL